MPPEKFRVQRLSGMEDFDPHPDSYKIKASGDHYIRLACPKKYWDKKKKR